jgi:hypothetical protein
MQCDAIRYDTILDMILYDMIRYMIIEQLIQQIVRLNHILAHAAAGCLQNQMISNFQAISGDHNVFYCHLLPDCQWRVRWDINGNVYYDG